MAYQDELAAANRLPTREARLAARNAVRAKYGMEAEKRKRGGFAGAYDRNKGLIQAALPTLAGFLVPGSSMLAGALTGGLARGLDRPGQRGIGLDLGQAARGAATGAALGGLGGGFRGAPAAPAAPKAPAMPAGPAPGQVMATPNYGAQIGTEAAMAAAPCQSARPLRRRPHRPQSRSSWRRCSGLRCLRRWLAGWPTCSAPRRIGRCRSAGFSWRRSRCGRSGSGRSGWPSS